MTPSASSMCAVRHFSQRNNICSLKHPNVLSRLLSVLLTNDTCHYNDVIMSAMASQNLTTVYSTVYSGADQRKHQSCALLAFVREIHRWPVNSPHKGPVTRKMFPFDDVIMCCATLRITKSIIVKFDGLCKIFCTNFATNIQNRCPTVSSGRKVQCKMNLNWCCMKYRVIVLYWTDCYASEMYSAFKSSFKMLFPYLPTCRTPKHHACSVNIYNC